jgi:acetolactate synthase-1/2/3 large subunit
VRVTLAEAVTDFIASQSGCVFGIPGGYLNAFIHAVHLARARGLQSIVSRHETGAVVMACGYGMARNEPGFAFAVPGGVTNTITGLASADCDNVPVFLLAGQAPSTHFAKDAHQETTGFTRAHDQIDLLRSVTAFSGRVPSSQAAMRVARLAARVMLEQRRPVAVEIPSNYLIEEVDYHPRSPLARPERVDEAAVQRLCTRLAAAQRPLIIIGNRAAKRGMADVLRQLCETACAPFAADFAKGVIAEDHPLSLGVIGESGHTAVAHYARDADLVITIGVRLSLHTTDGWRGFPNLIQIDEDLVDVDREMPASDYVIGDLPATLRAIARRVPCGARTRDAVERELHPLRTELDVAPATDELRSPAALGVLRDVIPRDAYIVADTGLTAQYVKRWFPVYAADGFFNLYGLASMGCGLPLALGVQVAAPERRVVNIMGDGGFLQYIGELSTQTQYALPVVHVILNNGGYKQIGDRLAWFFGHREMCSFTDDLARVGTAFGIHGERVERLSDLRPAMQRALASPTGAVVDIQVKGDDLSDFTPEATRETYRKVFANAPDKWRL